METKENTNFDIVEQLYVETELLLEVCRAVGVRYSRVANATIFENPEDVETVRSLFEQLGWIKP